MNRDQLIRIDHTLTSIHSNEDERPQPSQYSKYYQAIKELKDVHQKITSIKTKINNLVVKHKKHLFYQKQEQQRLKHLIQSNRKLKQYSKLQVIKSKTEVDLRKIIVENKKTQIAKRLDRAKRINTQDKYLSHDQIREQSIENQRKIQQYKKSLFFQNQIKHDRLYRNQNDSRERMKGLQERNRRKKKKFFSMYANDVYVKIQEKEKEKELQKIDHQCKKYEKFLKVITQKKYRKMKKIWSLRKNLPNLKNTQQIPKCQFNSHRSFQNYKTIS